MKKTNFMKSLILHIRYPWTAACLLILWIGFAVLCAILNFSTNEMLILLGVNGVATLIIALIGFRG